MSGHTGELNGREITAGLLERLVSGSEETRGRGGKVALKGKGSAERGWNTGRVREREKLEGRRRYRVLGGHL